MQTWLVEHCKQSDHPSGRPATALILAHASESPLTPQALNNWGLVLQELSTMAPDHERAQLVSQSVQKFRKAIRLRPEFDRACYNLGTVYYSHAHTLSSSAAAQLSSQLTKVSRRPDPAHTLRNITVRAVSAHF